MQSNVMGNLTYTPFDWQVPMKFLVLPVYEQNTKYCSFGSFLSMVLRTVFLKFSHMSDDGSEIDSKYDIHPSFVIVI